MATHFLALSMRFLGQILIISSAFGANIEVFRNDNFTGLVWNINLTANCTNIPTSKQELVYSVKTDACFIGYNHPDCYSFISAKYMPGDIHIHATQLGRHGYIKSFQSCNEQEGGNTLNIDINYQYTWSSFRLAPPVVLKSYRNVCLCVNVPESVQNLSYWSINNHHNSLLAYYEPDCSENKWSSKFIAAGHSSDSMYMHQQLKVDPITNISYQIQSFGPDPTSSYFHATCQLYSSRVASTNSKSIQTLIKNVEKLKNQVDQMKQNQEKFQGGLYDFLEKQNTQFNKIVKDNAYFREAFKNVTHNIKFDLHELFA